MPFDPPAAAAAAALWSGFLMIIMLVLSILVVRQRRAHSVAHGHGEQAALAGAIRAFGNASEYIPSAIGALAVLAIAGASPVVVHIAGGVLTVGRLIHAFGLSRTIGVSRSRVLGTMFTWIAYVFTAVALLFHALAS